MTNYTTLEKISFIHRPLTRLDLLLFLFYLQKSILFACTINNACVYLQNGPSGNCSGGGRNYQFEAAWDAILDRAGPYTVG